MRPVGRDRSSHWSWGERATGLWQQAALDSPLLGQHRTRLCGPSDSCAHVRHPSVSQSPPFLCAALPRRTWHPSPESNAWWPCVVARLLPRLSNFHDSSRKQGRQHGAHHPHMAGHQAYAYSHRRGRPRMQVDPRQGGACDNTSLPGSLPEFSSGKSHLPAED